MFKRTKTAALSAERPSGSVSMRAGLAITGTLLLVSACSSSNAVSGTATSHLAAKSAAGLARAESAVDEAEKTPTKIDQTAPLARPAPVGKLVVCLAVQDNPADIASCTQGLDVAASAMGWRDANFYYNDTDPADHNAALLSALAKHPSAVVDMGGQAEASYAATTLARYESAGVPIVVGNEPYWTPKRPFIGPIDGEPGLAEGGIDMANWVTADSHGHGSVLLVNVSAYAALIAIAASFNKTLAQNCPACTEKTVDLTLPQVSSGQIVPSVVDAIKSSPGVKYVVFTLAAFADGMESALKAADINGLDIVGEDVDPAGLAALRAKSAAAFTAGPAVAYIGFEAFDMVLRYITSGATSSPGDLPGPVQILTHENVANITTYSAPDDALRQFEALWRS